MKHRLHNNNYEHERNERAKNAQKQSLREKRARYDEAAVSDNFLKVKRRFLTGAIVKSAVCGVSFGLFAVGLLLLIMKLNGIPFGIVWYVVAGIACALLCGGITFLFLKPSNKRVAKTVDDEFGLKEQVQTSLAFSRDSGDVILMQRERAEDAIRALPRRKVKFSKIWQYFVIGILAVALAVAGILVPGKEVAGSTVEGEPSVSINENILITVGNLIEYIQGEQTNREYQQAEKDEGRDGHPENYMSEELADSVLEVLTAFHDDISDASVNNEEYPVSGVYPVLERINGIFTAETNYNIIADALAVQEVEFGTEGNFGEIVRAGGNAYRTHIFLEKSEIDSFHDNMNINATTSMNGKNSDFFAWLIPADPDEGDGTVTEPGAAPSEPAEPPAETKSDAELLAEMKEKLENINNVINVAEFTVDSDPAMVNDELLLAFDDLISKLSELVAGATELLKPDASLDADKFADFKAQTSQAFEDFFTWLAQGKEGLSETLAKQSYYLALDRYIGNNIRQAFGIDLIPADQIESGGTGNQGQGPGGTGGGDDGGGGSGPGGGSGNLQFPSADSVYDYRKGEVTFYGDLLSDYLAMMQEFLRDNGDNLSEKQKQMIQAYFNALYGNSAED